MPLSRLPRPKGGRRRFSHETRHRGRVFSERFVSSLCQQYPFLPSLRALNLGPVSRPAPAIHFFPVLMSASILTEGEASFQDPPPSVDPPSSFGQALILYNSGGGRWSFVLGQTLSQLPRSCDLRVPILFSQFSGIRRSGPMPQHCRLKTSLFPRIASASGRDTP